MKKSFFEKIVVVVVFLLLLFYCRDIFLKKPLWSSTFFIFLRAKNWCENESDSKKI